MDNLRFIGDDHFFKVRVPEDYLSNTKKPCVAIGNLITYAYNEHIGLGIRVEVELSLDHLIIKAGNNEWDKQEYHFQVTGAMQSWLKDLQDGNVDTFKEEILYLQFDHEYMDPFLGLGFCLGLPDDAEGTWVFNHQEHQYQQLSKHSDEELSNIDIAKRICKQYGLQYDDQFVSIDERGPYLALRYDEEEIQK